VTLSAPIASGDGHYLLEGLSYGDYFVSRVYAAPSSTPDYITKGSVTIDDARPDPTFVVIFLD
jgi:hypothetical protein